MNDNSPTKWIAKIALSIFALALSAQAQQNPPAAAPALPLPNDTARFLAGMPVPENSPLAPLTRDPTWQEHSAFFENAFAKLKELLRKAAERTQEDLWNRIGELLDQFSPEECSNYIRHAGYA